MNRGEHTATLHHGTSRIDPLPRTRVNTGETGGGLLLSMGPEVQILSGTPASNAENLYSRRCIYKKVRKSSFTVWDKFEYWYVHRASIFPASGMDRRSFLCLKPWAITRDWRLSADKRIDFPQGLEYNKIVEIAQNSSRNTTYYELRYHTGDFFHA